MSFVVKFGRDVSGAGLVLAAELFEFEIGADERDCTVDETSGECDYTDALGVNVGDVLVVNGVVELVCGSKPLTSAEEAPSSQPMKPRKLVSWEAALLLKELGFAAAALTTENAVCNVDEAP